MQSAAFIRPLDGKNFGKLVIRVGSEHPSLKQWRQLLKRRRDGNLITGQNPASSEASAEALLALLA